MHISKSYFPTLFVGLLCTLFSTLDSYAQPRVEYTYDNAGNRTQRQIVLEMPKENDSILVAEIGNPDFLEEIIEPSQDTLSDPFAEREDENSLTEKMGDLNVKLFPNPSSERVNLHVDYQGTTPEPITLTLCDLNGRLLQTKQIQGTQYIINLQPYQRGNYILKLTTESGISKEIRIVKQ